MMQSVVRLAVAVAFTAVLHVTPLFAQRGTGPSIVWISSTGADNSFCSAATPCATVLQAATVAANGGQISCLASPGLTEVDNIGSPFTLDCPGAWAAFGAALQLSGTSQVVKIRNLTFSGVSGGTPAIFLTGSGTLILENCVFENFSGPALDVEPAGPLNLVIKNSRIFNNGTGILIKPSSGGSVTATLDHITVENNSGGGVHTDSSNGAVTVDVIDSVINDNASNGFNVTSGTGGQNNVMNITRSTIAQNGLVGIQAGGGNAAVLLDTSLLDSNANGATLVGNSGRILSYGNNRIVGSAGVGFTGSASLQ